MSTWWSSVCSFLGTGRSFGTRFSKLHWRPMITYNVKCHGRERSIYRPKDWKSQEKDKMKKGNGTHKQDTNLIIFVPSTSGSVLKHQYHEEIIRHSIKMCAMEKAGRSVKTMLQWSDHFKSRIFDGVLCFIYETEKKELFDKNWVSYTTTCIGCENSEQKRKYQGETLKKCRYTYAREKIPSRIEKTIDGFCNAKTMARASWQPKSRIQDACSKTV